MRVKTIYTAPYIGAANAAIAKFLKITVSELETVESSSRAGGGTSISERKLESTTPRTGGLGEEFDGNDDEFSRFDLHAAVSSAKKQQPLPLPPRQNTTPSPYQKCKQKMSPSNPYKAQHSTIASGLTKPPHYPIHDGKLKSPIIHSANASTQEEQRKLNEMRKEVEDLKLEKKRIHKEVVKVKQQNNESEIENERLKKEFKSSKQEKEKLDGKTRALREEYDKVKNDLREAKQQKEKLDADARIAHEKKEQIEKESQIIREGNVCMEKLKAQTRALREEHEKVKSDLRIAEQQRHKSEKNARIAREEKERYEKDAEAAEESLDLRRAEIDSLTKQNPAKRKPAEKSKPKNPSEPSKKKRKARKQAKSDTIVKSMKVGNLKEEAAVQGIDVQEVLRMTKTELLNLMPAGSTCITKTDAWGEVLCIRENFESERREAEKKSGTIINSMTVGDLKEEAIARGVEVKELARMTKAELLNSMVVGSTCITNTDVWGDVLRIRENIASKRREVEKQENKRLHELQLKQEKEERERQEKLKDLREKERAEEKTSHVAKHTYHFPAVHSCKLAKTADLLFHGEPRCYNSHCSECRLGFRNALYTCEKCDFDICEGCFKEKTMTPAEKEAEAKREAARKREMLEEAATRRRLQEEREEERRKQWDPKSHFKPKIIDPPDKNIDLDANKTKGFTVWCSDGYGYDGFHSYEGAPGKEFDATYRTKEEANERARYLFHWKNPWGHRPDMIMEEEVDKSMKDGLVTYCVSPPDSTTW
eukprot:CAMPEP_0201670668 /NCGR_PEP_ID=MMETSP0494-20130426/27495_1 /ASSEMBLY_ACC=CAM_ASM_000839 /TAXON_ID=420259 /ORGANISM="Thalassiosira gravida, Strain GMp14c1" /LENGTH=764 /DNA_ID=CAMNT_0048151785 /DNA_START=510 /DNA_END=2801 /DNA_ORIENTATION=-